MHTHKTLDYKIDPLLQRDQKTCHSLVGNRESFTFMKQFLKVGNHRPVTADHIPVTHDGKTGLFRTDNIIRRNEKFITRQFCRTVKVDRTCRFIGREGNHLLHPAIDRRIDHKFRTVDIGIYTLHRIVFGNMHMLHRRRMHDKIYPLHRFTQPLKITHIPDKKAHTRIRKLLRHLKMFLFITGVDNDFVGLITF